MAYRLFIFTGLLLLAAKLGMASNDSHEVIGELLATSCIDCHGSDSDTGFDVSALSYDFRDETQFRNWMKVFDRVSRGEMPPKDAVQPADELRAEALKRLQPSLIEANLKEQQVAGRVPSRRLTRNEYEHVLHDLLGIGGQIARFLPPENEAASFDVVADKQGMSSVHVRALLSAADLALDEAIQLTYKPNLGPRELDYYNSPYIQMWVDRELRRGGGTVFKTDKDVVTFRGANSVLRSDSNGIRFSVPGQ